MNITSTVVIHISDDESFAYLLSACDLRIIAIRYDDQRKSINISHYSTIGADKVSTLTLTVPVTTIDALGHFKTG